MRSLLLLLIVLPLLVSSACQWDADMTCEEHPEPDLALIWNAAEETFAGLFGERWTSWLHVSLLEIDGQPCTAWRTWLTVGHHTVKFFLAKDVDDSWGLRLGQRVPPPVRAPKYEDDYRTYVGEVHFVARRGGRYRVRAEKRPLRAWVEENVAGYFYLVAEARLLEVVPGQTLDEAFARLRRGEGAVEVLAPQGR